MEMKDIDEDWDNQQTFKKIKTNKKLLSYYPFWLNEMFGSKFTLTSKYERLF
jgi:hypothetical protein